MPFATIMGKVEHGELPSFESITRARRKIMEECPSLRGKSYKQRLDKQEEYIQFARESTNG